MTAPQQKFVNTKLVFIEITKPNLNLNDIYFQVRVTVYPITSPG